MFEKQVAETFDDIIWQFKNKYLHFLLISLFLIALAYGSTMACQYFAQGKCQIPLPK